MCSKDSIVGFCKQTGRERGWGTQEEQNWPWRNVKKKQQAPNSQLCFSHYSRHYWSEVHGFWQTLDFHNWKAVVSSCGDNVESPDPSLSRFGLCFAPTHLLFQDTGLVHLRQTAGIAEKSALLREALDSAPLCVLESFFPACSFPTDIQAHRHCDQIIRSLNSRSFTFLTVFWFLESPYFLSFRVPLLSEF